eukprot:2937997-Prymnesium_polylepis.1
MASAAAWGRTSLASARRVGSSKCAHAPQPSLHCAKQIDRCSHRSSGCAGALRRARAARERNEPTGRTVTVRVRARGQASGLGFQGHASGAGGFSRVVPVRAFREATHGPQLAATRSSSAP